VLTVLTSRIDHAGVVELVDTQDLGSCAFGCEGSSPSFGTVFDLLSTRCGSRS
jgi:hypothetical protein